MINCFFIQIRHWKDSKTRLWKLAICCHSCGSGKVFYEITNYLCSGYKSICCNSLNKNDVMSDKLYLLMQKKPRNNFLFMYLVEARFFFFTSAENLFSTINTSNIYDSDGLQYNYFFIVRNICTKYLHDNKLLNILCHFVFKV